MREDIPTFNGACEANPYETCTAALHPRHFPKNFRAGWSCCEILQEASYRNMCKTSLFVVGAEIPVLGPPVVPFYRFFLGEGSPTKIDYRKRSRVPTCSNLSNLGDLV